MSRLGRNSRQDFIDRNRNINLSSSEAEPDTVLLFDKMSELEAIYKGLRFVPDFDGNPNVLTRFIHLCDHLAGQFSNVQSSELSKCALINGILNKVIGPAARLINANGIPSDWNGIRSALVNNFADHRDETALYNDLSILRQGSSTPQEFYERCQNLFSTILTYISLHDTVQATIDSKRELYRKLTLQAYLRGLNEPLGSRIRCMRPETIEKALEFVHEEINTIYLQSRNERISDRKMINQVPVWNSFKMQPTLAPPPRPINYGMPGPSRQEFFAQPSHQWKPNFYQPRQFGPTRTQQIFRAPLANYNPNNTFQMPPRPSQQAVPRPMSGVTHFVPRLLPPSATPGLTGHDWRKSGNPAPNNYFKTREMHFNDCSNDFFLNDEYYYNDYFEPYYNYYEHLENEPSNQEFVDCSGISNEVAEEANVKSTESDFQKTLKSDTLK